MSYIQDRLLKSPQSPKTACSSKIYILASTVSSQQGNFEENKADPSRSAVRVKNVMMKTMGAVGQEFPDKEALTRQELSWMENFFSPKVSKLGSPLIGNY